MGNIILLIIVMILILLMLYLLYLKYNSSEMQLVSCFNRRFGCCNDKYTPKLDIYGSNCRGF